MFFFQFLISSRSAPVPAVVVVSSILSCLFDKDAEGLGAGGVVIGAGGGGGGGVGAAGGGGGTEATDLGGLLIGTLTFRSNL